MTRTVPAWVLGIAVFLCTAVATWALTVLEFLFAWLLIDVWGFADMPAAVRLGLLLVWTALFMAALIGLPVWLSGLFDRRLRTRRQVVLATAAVLLGISFFLLASSLSVANECLTEYQLPFAVDSFCSSD